MQHPLIDQTELVHCTSAGGVQIVRKVYLTCERSPEAVSEVTSYVRGYLAERGLREQFEIVGIEERDDA